MNSYINVVACEKRVKSYKSNFSEEQKQSLLKYVRPRKVLESVCEYLGLISYEP